MLQQLQSIVSKQYNINARGLRPHPNRTVGWQLARLEQHVAQSCLRQPHQSAPKLKMAALAVAEKKEVEMSSAAAEEPPQQV